MSGFTWPLVIAIMITGPFVGKILDAGFHQVYNARLKEWIYSRAIRFDELTYGRLAHQDIQKVLSLFRRLFGSRLFSYQAAIWTALMVLPSLILAMGSAQIPAFGTLEDFWSDIDATTPTMWMSVIYYSFLLIFFSIAVVQASLLITRTILSIIKPIFSSFALWAMLDIFMIFLIGPLPFAAAQFFYYLPTDVGIAADLALYSYGATVFSLISIFVIPSDLGSTNFILVVITALIAFPTLLHLYLVTRDLLFKLVMKPLFRFLSGLFEYIEQEKRPLAWTFGLLGTLPAVLKAWADVVTK